MKILKSPLGLIILSMALALLLAEGLIRLYSNHIGIDYLLLRKSMSNPQRFPSELRLPNSPLPQLLPSAQGVAKTSDFEVLYKTNSKGLRSSEIPYELNPTKKRVVVLGDSFTFGEGIAEGERFIDILSKAYPNWEIVNMALPGHGIEHQFIYLLQEGLRYHPELVLLFINKVDTERWIDPLVQNQRVILPDENIFINVVPQNTSGTIYKRNEKPWDFSWTDYSQLFQFFAYRNDLKKLVTLDEKKWRTSSFEKNKDGEKVLEEISPEIKQRATLIFNSYLKLAHQNRFQFITINIDPNTDLSYLKKALPELDYRDLAFKLSERAKSYPLRFIYDRHFNSDTHKFIGLNLQEILAK